MNAQRLLAHYEEIADGAEAIASLRRFILDLAVRGKLVPQDAGDEPASELLKRIATERTRLVKAGAIRKPKAIPRLAETPFPIPSNWLWSQLAEIGVLSPRNEAHDTLKASFVPMPLIAAEYGVANQHEVRTWGEIKKGYTHFAEGDVGLAKITPCFENGKSSVFRNLTGGIGSGTTELHIVRPIFIDQDYILLFLKSPHFIGAGIPKMTGTAGQKRVPTEFFAHSPFPLPPLAEQHRIVAKVDELMGLCDRLAAARAGREAVRERLAAASLARLNSPNPETFHSDARFALDALPALTARPDQIKALRQTILNLAVRGKLVPQDANDEPASDLLKRIAKEKARRVKEGKAKRQDSLAEIDLDLAPFELPSGWTWGRFPEVGTFGRGKSKHRPRNDPALFDGGEHLMIQTGDVARSRGVINTYTSKYNDFGLSQSFKWPKGTLCIAIAANIADSGILSFDACFPDSVVGFTPASMFENARYFEYFVRTAKANLLEFAPATAQKNINLEILTKVLIPLPPLAEQHRIVAKVDAMMALCDRLEASLTATAATRRRLIDALLAEALAPAEQSTSNVNVGLAAAVNNSGQQDVNLTERSAYILSRAYERHRTARRDWTFGHVKAQKILHLVEAEAGYDLGRVPIKDAAGPNDFRHMLAVEEWAFSNKRFVFEHSGGGYRFRELPNFQESLRKENQPEASIRTLIDRLIDILVPMDMREAEVLVTVYSAWNNLLLEGKAPTEEQVVRAAREDWHPSKLKIPANEFFAALKHLKLKGLVPKGLGKVVHGARQRDLFD